jgi:hypothetical protein
MKRLLATIASMSLVPTAVLIPGVAWSSACNEEIVVEIHMAAGERCWVYRGNATSFTGKFASGQTVEVRMSGESAEHDPATKKDVVSWEARSPSVEGPDKFFAEAKVDSYTDRLLSCAMWGGKGEVHICVK